MEEILKIMDEKVEKTKQSWFTTKSNLGYAYQKGNKKEISFWKKLEKESFQKFLTESQFVFNIKFNLGLIKKEE
jgi:hypothetical protein